MRTVEVVPARLRATPVRATLLVAAIVLVTEVGCESAATPRAVHIPVQDLSLVADWFAPRATRAPAVILLHGWMPYSEHASHTMHDAARALHKLGYAVLVPSLRGWPATGGVDDCGYRQAHDIARAAEWLARQPGVDPQRVAAVGISQGGQVALLAAARSPALRAIVALAPPTDPVRWAASAAHPGIAPYVSETCTSALGHAPLAVAAHFSQPVLLVHGTADTRVPPEQSQRFADARRRAKLPVENVWLTDIGHDFDALFQVQTIDAFLQRVLHHAPGDVPGSRDVLPAKN